MRLTFLLLLRSAAVFQISSVHFSGSLAAHMDLFLGRLISALGV